MPTRLLKEIFDAVSRALQVITTLVIILAIVTGLYMSGWIYQGIKKWKQSLKPQPVESISMSVNDPTRVATTSQPQEQSQHIQLNNQAFNPQIAEPVLLVSLSIIVFFATIMKFALDVSNEKFYKFRPLLVQICAQFLLLYSFYARNSSLRKFVWEMYFQ